MVRTCEQRAVGQRTWPENKPLPLRAESGEWKSWLKLNIQKTKIIASGPITSWEIDGETVADFIFLGSKITADGDCSDEIKRCLLFGKTDAEAEAQAGIKIARRNINNLRYADDTTLMAESEEELKSLLMKVKEESEKVRWKLNIQKEIMASSPITSWQIDGETVADFIFWGLQNHCRWWLQPWKKKKK